MKTFKICPNGTIVICVNGKCTRHFSCPGDREEYTRDGFEEVPFEHLPPFGAGVSIPQGGLKGDVIKAE